MCASLRHSRRLRELHPKLAVRADDAGDRDMVIDRVAVLDETGARSLLRMDSNGLDSRSVLDEHRAHAASPSGRLVAGNGEAAKGTEGTAQCTDLKGQTWH